MRVLNGTEWRDGYLAYWQGPDEVRVEVKAWQNVARLDDLYFVRRRSIRTIRNYLAEVHPVDMWRKIQSRLGERSRNEKFFSYGFGEIVRSPRTAEGPDAGDLVFFVAPSHPRCVSQLSLPPSLTLPLEDVGADARSLQREAGEVLYLAMEPGTDLPSGAEVLRGWSRYSGRPADSPQMLDAVRALAPLAAKAPWGKARRLGGSRSAREDASTSESAARSIGGTGRSAVLFGYGHYAKTTALPSVSARITVRKIHEIDPTQIPLQGGPAVSWDTSPVPSDDEGADVWMIAGYHGEHAPLAAEGLRRGADVILEKPLAVSESQLEDLLGAVGAGRGRIFACFQRRYGPFNAMARHDLDAGPGDPISYHCIVYEVPLPTLHWYRWPASGSRLISNGCHWIDHFLHLNDYAPVRRYWLTEAADETITCAIELENDAVFSMTLTDVGSERLGVQDHVELRAGSATVTITNNSRYRSESTERVLRTKRVSRGDSYRAMYATIARRIEDGGEGDTLASIERSTRTVLNLEQQLRAARGVTHSGLAP